MQSNDIVISAFSDTYDYDCQTFFEKLQPKLVNYREYNCFENDRFRVYLLLELGNANIEEKRNGLNKVLNVCKKY